MGKIKLAFVLTAYISLGGVIGFSVCKRFVKTRYWMCEPTKNPNVQHCREFYAIPGRDNLEYGE